MSSAETPTLTPEEVQQFTALLDDPTTRAFLALRVFKAFVHVFWPVIFPHQPLAWNWHMDRFCEAVQRQVDGDPEYRWLVIEVPPGFNKSVFFSVMRPAWIWLRQPWRCSIYFSAGSAVAERDSRRTRDIISSPFYDLCRQVAVTLGFYKSNWTFRTDQNEKDNFQNDHGGVRQCYGIFENWIGMRCHDIVEDDLVDAKVAVKMQPAQLAEKMQTLHSIRHNAVLSRVIDPKTATRTLIMQGLCEGDPADDEIKRGGRKVLCFPMEFDPEHPQYDPKVDPRTTPGELLHEAWFPRDVLERDFKAEMDDEHYSAQYQQRRIASKGRQVQKEWLATAPRFQDDPAEMAATCDVVDISIDPSGKGKATSDEASFQVMGRRAASAVLLHVEDSQQGLVGTIRTAVRLRARFPMYRYLYVEDTALGPATIEMLKRGGSIPASDGDPALTFAPFRGVIAVVPRGSKGQRLAEGTIPYLKAGDLTIPADEVCPGIRAWLRDHERFVDGPRSRRDGNIDATSQVLNQWKQEDLDPAWLPDTMLPTVVQTFRPPTAIPMPKGATATAWWALPRVHPNEDYVLGLVPTWASGGQGAPTVGMLLSEGGDLVASLTVTDGGEENIAEAVVRLAMWVARFGAGGDAQRSTITVRLGTTPTTIGVAQAVAARLSPQYLHARVVPEPGAYVDDPDAFWRDDPRGIARATLFAPMQTALAAERLTIADKDLVTAMGELVVDRETGRPRSSRTSDPQMHMPGSDLDVRVVALALAEGLRQRNAATLTLVNGGKRPERNDYQRYIDGRKATGSRDFMEAGLATMRR